MKAVHNAQLSMYPSGLDVLVLPSRGSVSPASLLSGGDFDGDTAMVLFCPDIVNAFKPTTPQNSTRRNIEAYFTTEPLDMKSLRDELYNHNSNGEEEANQYLKPHLLESLRHTQFVGIYGRLHENACYKKGFASDEAITLAHMLVNIIGPKYGTYRCSVSIRVWIQQNLDIASNPRCLRNTKSNSIWAADQRMCRLALTVLPL